MAAALFPPAWGHQTQMAFGGCGWAQKTGEGRRLGDTTEDALTGCHKIVVVRLEVK
jgi:hypothetical protein